MRKRTKLGIAAGGVLALIAAGAGIAVAAGGDDDHPLTGSDLAAATQAALEHTGGGTVVETEAGDDGSAYGVEIRLDDGRVVEVNLNADFQIIGSERDDDTSQAGGTDD